uniref:Uncharacterized protein n=1 Tax=Alexandrium monilatum TaxID=311494 RepID=A0A7S4WCD0_9DINO
MARRAGALLPVCLAALCLCGLLQLLPRSVDPAFVPPQRLRGEAAAGVAAALLAAAAAGPLPVEAVTAKFSIFGFGDGYSDPYQANDADAISPYSQFSNPKDSIYKKGTDDIVARKKKQLDDSFGRLDKIPGLLRAKAGEEVKSILTLQLYTMRANMEYLSGEVDSAEFGKARDFFQEVADVGVGNRQKNWDFAQESYDKAMRSLGEWKTMVRY